MQITSVSYSFLSNLGDYQNERIEMEAKLEEGDSPEETIKILKERVLAQCGEHAAKLEHRRWKLQDKCDQLERKLVDYQRKWNAAAEFLRAQGIKPDAPDFPEIVGFLSAGSEPETVEAELDDIPI